MTYHTELVLLYNTPNVETSTDVVLNKDEALRNIADEIRRARPPIAVLFVLIAIMLGSIAATLIVVIGFTTTLPELAQSVSWEIIVKIAAIGFATLVCTLIALLMIGIVFKTINQLFIHTSPELHYAKLTQEGSIVYGKVLTIRKVKNTHLREITYLYDTPKTRTGKYVTDADVDIRADYQVKVLYNAFIAVLL